MPNLLTAVGFTVLGACAEDKIPEQKIHTDPRATCGVTLLTNVMENLGNQIRADLRKNENPFIRVTIDTDEMNLPDTINALLPSDSEGEVDGAGLLTSYEYVASFLSSTDGKNYYHEKSAGTACSDNTFAYNFGTEDLLLTGQCTWTNDEIQDPIGTCLGNMYETCPYETNNRNNYPDCSLLTGYTDATAYIQFLEES